MVPVVRLAALTPVLLLATGALRPRGEGAKPVGAASPVTEETEE